MNDFSREDFEAVQSLTTASAQMSKVLTRIRTLESGLEAARSALSRAKDMIAPTLYVYGGKDKAVDNVQKSIEAVTTCLGR